MDRREFLGFVANSGAVGWIVTGSLGTAGARIAVCESRTTRAVAYHGEFELCRGECAVCR